MSGVKAGVMIDQALCDGESASRFKAFLRAEFLPGDSDNLETVLLTQSLLV